MCHFWGAFFRPENKFWGIIFAKITSSHEFWGVILENNSLGIDLDQISFILGYTLSMAGKFWGIIFAKRYKF